MSLSYPVVLIKSDEGYTARCPAVPGCWSQGATEKEALQNIREAIQEYQAVIELSRRTSGLIEQQYWFMKVARRDELQRRRRETEA
jgi:predicted RNase H-like HicB family nuclease